MGILGGASDVRAKLRKDVEKLIVNDKTKEALEHLLSHFGDETSELADATRLRMQQYEALQKSRIAGSVDADKYATKNAEIGQAVLDIAQAVSSGIAPPPDPDPGRKERLIELLLRMLQSIPQNLLFLGVVAAGLILLTVTLTKFVVWPSSRPATVTPSPIAAVLTLSRPKIIESAIGAALLTPTVTGASKQSAASTPTFTSTPTTVPTSTSTPSATHTSPPDPTPTATHTPPPRTTPTPTHTLTPTPTLVPGTTWVNLKDGAVYIYVPGKRADNTQAFWIKQTEVTNAEYLRCVEAGECQSTGFADELIDPLLKNHPVRMLRLGQARRYAEWAGGRLPTEQEWMRACQGPVDQLYPWGFEKPDKTRANYGGAIGKTAPVGSYPSGASPYGVLDLVGNVWEYTSTPAKEGDNDWFIVRGGGWDDHESMLACTDYHRQANLPELRRRASDGGRTYNIGFRVVVVR